MHLHLVLPEALAADAEWPAATGATELGTLVQQEDGGEEDDETSTTSTIVSFLPLILIVAAVYFLLLRPRQRQMRQQRELQANLDVGDEVMLTSGVYGFITGFEPGSDVVWVEIDDDVQIRVSRAAISGKVNVSTASTSSATGDDASRRPTLKGGARTAESEDKPAPAESE